MTKYLLLGPSLLFASFINAQTLETVTNEGNETPNTIRVTSQAKTPTAGQGLEIQYRNTETLYSGSGFGVIESRDRFSGAYKDLAINALNSKFSVGANGKFIFDGGNTGFGTTSPFAGTANSGIHISKGNHSSILLGNPVSEGYGGIVQTTDNRHRVFIGANLYDDLTASWKTFQTGKGSAGISLIADQGSWGTSIQFHVNDNDGYLERMVIKGNGNIGISTTTPTERLDVAGNLLLRNTENLQSKGSSIQFSSFGSDHLGPKIRSSLEMAQGTTSRSKLILSSYWGGYKDELTLVDGKVGVGTTSPQSKLEVFDNTEYKDNEVLRLKSGIAWGGNAGHISMTVGNVENARIGWSMTNGNVLDGNLVFATKAANGVLNERLRIDSEGRIGIGTSTPKEELSVNGRIRAREIKVETDNWPDYVFFDNHQLLSLAQLEGYIKINKHLPGIPSAKEAEADGVDLGEMNKKLLQKVEELTLYLIEKDKEISELKKLEKRMAELEKKINK